MPVALALDFAAADALFDFEEVFKDDDDLESDLDEIAEAAAAAAARFEVRVRVALGDEDSLAAEGSRDDCELGGVEVFWSSRSSL